MTLETRFPCKSVVAHSHLYPINLASYAAALRWEQAALRRASRKNSRDTWSQLTYEWHRTKQTKATAEYVACKACIPKLSAMLFTAKDLISRISKPLQFRSTESAILTARRRLVSQKTRRKKMLAFEFPLAVTSQALTASARTYVIAYR